MMKLTLLFLCATCFCTTVFAQQEESKLWALLVAGSNGYDNYRHQADICHAYQILHAHGVPDENIIVMMYDDIANSENNPTPGIIINHPDGEDVYHGVLKDYVGEDVTPENFLSVLLGDEDAMRGKGSGKVIKSGPNDNIFVNFVDHGATGLLAFPSGELTVEQLNNALKQLHKKNVYKKMVMYIEACESGSMFRDVLSNKLNIFVTTAADFDESSYACYFDERRQTYLGDWYSVNWMEDSDAEDIASETLQKQFGIVKRRTNTSHVQEYGDMTLSTLPVGEFQGEEEAPRKIRQKVPYKTGSPSWEVPLDILYKRLAKSTSDAERGTVQTKINEMLDKRGYLESVVLKIVRRVAYAPEHQQRLTASRPQRLTRLACHTRLVKAFSHYCFDFGQNSYALKYAYILANMCEERLDEDDVIRTMRRVCRARMITSNIV